MLRMTCIAEITHRRLSLRWTRRNYPKNLNKKSVFAFTSHQKLSIVFYSCRIGLLKCCTWFFCIRFNTIVVDVKQATNKQIKKIFFSFHESLYRWTALPSLFRDLVFTFIVPMIVLSPFSVSDEQKQEESSTEILPYDSTGRKAAYGIAYGALVLTAVALYAYLSKKVCYHIFFQSSSLFL